MDGKAWSATVLGSWRVGHDGETSLTHSQGHLSIEYQCGLCKKVILELKSELFDVSLIKENNENNGHYALRSEAKGK